MKANKAPEKVYIDANEDWHRTYTAFTEKAKGNDIEYVRTDAFIEKAEEFLIDNLKEIPMGNGKFKIKAECSLQEFLDKLEKYVKGE